jgi:cytoskeletal protein CcmA (bactofilin family)
MKHKIAVRKWFSLFSLLLLATFVFVPTAYAFDGRGGDRIVIPADEVVNDDLYLGAEEIVIDGTIQGDLVAGARTITINGTIEGDLIAAGQEIIINGSVLDDVRVAGAVLTLGSQARVSDDLLGVGYSLETRSGSAVGGIIGFGGYQALLTGDVHEDVYLGTNRAYLDGKVQGDVTASVTSGTDQPPFNSWMYTPNMPVVPSVPAGLNLGDNAQVDGSLEYTTREPQSIPPAQVLGPIDHIIPEITMQTGEVPQGSVAAASFLRSLRRGIALIVVGLLIAWLAPAWILKPADELQQRPWASLGWGFVTLFLFPPALFLLIGVTVLIGVLLGALTLGNLVGVTAVLGTTFITSVIAGFWLLASYMAKIVVAFAAGRWIVANFKPEWLGKPYASLLIGTILLAILIAVPFLGFVSNFIITLLGLGTFFLLISGRLLNGSRPAGPVVDAA